MDNNSALNILSEMINKAEQFTRIIQTGDGMGFTPEQKAEFLKQVKEKKVDDQMRETLEKVEKMRANIAKGNS